jgi:hypothetical protein
MDVFISYRREFSSLRAESIYNKLSSDGFDVFLDRKTLHTFSGVFSPEIIQCIEGVHDFLLILCGNCLDSIEDYDKSVFIREILCAREKNIPIIPIICDGFSYPANLHESISFLPHLESLTIQDMRYFESAFYEDLYAKMSPCDKRDAALSKLIHRTVLETRSSIEKRHSLFDRLSGDVVSVDICAASANGLLNTAGECFQNIAGRDGKIRVVINQPDTDAIIEAYKHKFRGATARHRRQNSRHSYDELLGWKEEFPEQFDCRTADFPLTCAIFIVRKKNPKESTIKVDYYDFDCTDAERRSLYIQYADRNNFDFYVHQFQWIWEHSSEITDETEYS